LSNQRFKKLVLRKKKMMMILMITWTLMK